MTISNRFLASSLVFLCGLTINAQDTEINTWQNNNDSFYGEDIGKQLSVDYFEDKGTFFHNWNNILEESNEANTLTNDFIKKEIEKTNVKQVNTIYFLNGKKLNLPTMINENGIDMYLLTEEGITIYMALNPPAYWNETYNDIIKWIRFYAYKKRQRTATMFARFQKWEKYIDAVFKEERVPSELGILCMVESACTYNAVSKVGAAGMWQIMPETGKGFGMKVNSYVDERFDPVISTKYAGKILNNNYRQTRNWTLALASYNCGAGRISKTSTKFGTTDWLTLKNYLPEETRQYVPSVIALYYIWTYRKQLGF